MSDLPNTYLPLRTDIENWASTPFFPADLLGSPDDSLLDRLYLTLVSSRETEDESIVDLAIGWEGSEEATFPLLGIQGLSLVLGGGMSQSVALSLTFAEDGLHFAVTSRIALRFATDLIRPAVLENGVYRALDEGVYEVALENATVTLDTSGDITFDNFETVSFGPFAIGETGVVVVPGTVTLCFSANVAATLMSDHPDAGLTASFRGVFMEEASVYFPETFPIESVTMRNAFIGNLGFTGTIVTDIDDPDSGLVDRGACMGFPFVLQSVTLSFVQNAITACIIEGDLTIPFFDETIVVTLGMGLDGALTLAVADPDGLAGLDVPQVGRLDLTGFGVINDDLGIGLLLSGRLLLSAAGLQWPEISIQDLCIRPDGRISVPSGWLDLQTPIAVDLFGFRLEISQLGFGKEDDGRSWIGFSGGLHLIDLLPTGASVEGMRILWQPGANVPIQITLQGVGLELSVPGAVHFTGDVSMVNEADDHYFAGSALLELTPIGVNLDAVVKIGHKTDPETNLDFNYVYIYLSLELPIGIPLWATGTALYGISGLLGVNVEPDTTGSDWYGWYARDPQFNITDDSKWRGALDSMAFGAGVVIGTVFDTGFTVSTKSLIALLLPGPVILFNGKTNFLQLPPGLMGSSEGSLDMLAVLDANAGNFLFTIDAGWDLKQVVDLHASAEAYFDFARPDNWHLYLGQDEPPERRIRASVLSLFDANTYLMIDGEGIAAGFGVDFGDEWRFGPVRVALMSWIAAAAGITWQPPQLTGSLGVGGEFSIGVAGFSAGIAAEAELSGKAPKPYWIRGELTVRLNLPAPIKDLEESILLEWKQDLPPDVQDAFSSSSLEHLKVSETWAPRMSTTAADPTSGGYDAGPIVPLDARPLVVFNRAVQDNSSLNSVNADYPGSTRIGDYTFDYELEADSIQLDMWSKAGAGGWTAFPAEDLSGAWTVEVDGTGKVSASKLQIMAKTPFAFTRRTSRTFADWFLSTHRDWPCGDDAGPAEIHCVDWSHEPPDVPLGTAFTFEGLTFLSNFVMGVMRGQFIEACPRPDGKALHFAYSLWIQFPEPVRRVELCLGGTFEVARAYAGGVELQHVNSPEGVVVLEASGIEWVEVQSPHDDAFLMHVCYTTEAGAAAAESETDRLERLEANVLRWSSTDEILPPNTYFRLKVVSKTIRKRDGVTDDEQSWTHYAYFQTDGPPALIPAWAEPAPPSSSSGLDVGSYPTGGQLTDLSPYVATTIPAHGQTAVYRAYGLGAEFNENYVQQMVGADMVVRLRDANDQPILDGDGNELTFLNAWDALPTTELSITEIPFVTRLQDCMPMSVEGIAPDETLITTYGVLFEEDFSGTLDNWTDVDAPDGDPNANWTVLDGRVTLTGTVISPLGALLVAGDPAWSDYGIEAELTESGVEAGLVFRFSEGEARQYYRLRLNNTGRYLDRITGTDVQTLWQDDTPYTPTLHQVLAVQCHGPRLRGQLGSELLFDLNDEEPLTAGQIGLYTNVEAAFDHVLVREWPGVVLAAETLYQAELAASYVLFQVGGWPSYASVLGWTDLHDTAQADQRMVLIGQENWTNYRLEATISPANNERVGLLTRVQLDSGGGTFQCYRLFWNPRDDIIRFALLTGTLDLSNNTYNVDTRNVLWDCTGAACGIDFNLDEHDLALNCEGESFSITVDGYEIASVVDSTLPSGMFGLFYDGPASTPTAFSDILLRTTPRDKVYGWQFSSSAYAGFVEHMDSFTGVAYDDVESQPDGPDLSARIVSAAAAMADADAAVADARADLAGATALTMTQMLQAAHTALAARRQTAGSQFDSLYVLFFGEQYRPFPPAVELTELHGSDGRYALLFESPEPLDWDRISFVLKRKTQSGEYREVSGSPFVIWNTDGTRALFMGANGAALPGGDYALHLAMQLDIGSEATVLRRNGSTIPEVAALHFSVE